MHQNWQNLTDSIAHINDIGIGTSHLDFQLEWSSHGSSKVLNFDVLE